MPNAIAYLALLLWPAVCLLLFRKLPVGRAILWSLLAGYLLLPPLAEFDLPLVPDMNKYTIPSLAAFLACVLVARKPVPVWPSHPAIKVLIVLFVAGVIPTVLTNRDPVLFLGLGQSESMRVITGAKPGLRWIDIASVVSNQLIVLLPFFLARRYLSTDAGLRAILVALAASALAYSLPALLEIMIGPKVNIWVYGFFQHSLSQMIRNGGYRPIVFLPHGLWLAFFTMTAVLAAAALAKTAKGPDRIRFAMATAYLFAVLVLCKSLASLLYGLAFTPLVALTPMRLQLRAALLLAVIAFCFPALRNLGLIPTEALVSLAEQISPDRARSLAYRFENEQLLLERAAERPWLGWGGWGRWLVWDHDSGERISVPDGYWIITFGTYGWLGYVAEMGLLTAPLALLAAQARKQPLGAVSRFAAPVALILAATMVDMLINATLIPFTWMCAGAVLGHAERLKYGSLSRPKPTLFGGTQALEGQTRRAGPLM